MTPEQWARVEDLYDEISELDSHARAARLESLRQEDRGLAWTLERMLQATPSSSFLDPSPLDQPTDQEGSEFPRFSNYRVLRVIGGGGMGTVYHAEQIRPRREVALKVLKRGLGGQEEASYTAGLKHEGIVTVYEVGYENDCHFYSMELVEGLDLAQCIARLRASAGKDEQGDAGSPLPVFRSKGSVRIIAEIGVEISDALGAAHKMDVLHRDVKPSNILLTPDRKVKIVDFGIAASMRQTDGRGAFGFFGDPPYMSPERLRAQSERVDRRTDVYSIGVVLYELLTLRRPFGDGSNMEVVGRILNGAEPTPIRRWNQMVPVDLQTIVEKAMAADPDERYATAIDLRNDLLRFLAHEAIVGRPEGVVHRAKKWIYRRRRRAAVLAVVAGAAIAASLWTAHQTRRQELEAVQAAATQMLALGPFESLPVNDKCSIAKLVTNFDRQRLGPPPEQVVELETCLRQYRDQELRRAAQEIEEWGRPELMDRDREFGRLELMRRLIDLRAVFPLDVEVQRVTSIESMSPRLSVRAMNATGESIAARVSVVEMSTLGMRPGAVRYQGAAPVERAPLAPGYYRLSVHFADGGSRELPVYFGLNSVETMIDVHRRQDESEIERDMIALPGGDVAMPREYSKLPFGEQTVRVDPFLIDATEVSNRQYREFVVATSRSAPAYWPETYDPSMDDLPVVGVTWCDAVAYAGWAGKRLPTLPEWLWAVGVGAGRPWPWSSADAEEDPSTRGNVNGELHAGKPSRDGEWSCYMANARPVRSHPEAATPDGVFHLHGNVSEWTESMAVTFVDMDSTWSAGPGRAVRTTAVSPWERIIAGAAWDARSAHRPVVFIREYGISSSDFTYHLGFRCAKSLDR